MKKYRSLVYAAALAVVAASTTACQRGYGCPNELSVAADLANVALEATRVAQPSAPQ